MEIKDLNRPPRELVEEFRSVGTSTLGDILDTRGLEGVVSGLRPMKDGSVLVGPAVTVKQISGVVVIPQERARDILKEAQAAEKAEEHFVEQLKKGKTFLEAQKSTGRL